MRDQRHSNKGRRLGSDRADLSVRCSTMRPCEMDGLIWKEGPYEEATHTLGDTRSTGGMGWGRYGPCQWSDIPSHRQSRKLVRMYDQHFIEFWVCASGARQ